MLLPLPAVAQTAAPSPILAAAGGNFFSDLFGLLSGQPAPPRQRMEAPIQVPGYGAPRRPDRKLPSNPLSGSGSSNFGGGSDTAEAPRRPRGGGYRTMCVRLCDGYYWPISNDASSDDFGADKRSCESSCLAPAKLYYQTDGGEDPAAMRSLDGQVYKKLDTAFAYRKSLQPACRCKADPWSASEQMRHQSYAQSQPSLAAEPAATEVTRSVSLDLFGDPPADAAIPINGEQPAVR